MKLPVSLKANRTLIIILLISFAIGSLCVLNAWKSASAQNERKVNETRQISPVTHSERELYQLIMQQREKRGVVSFVPSWNLFRAARIEAGQLASNQDGQTNAVQILKSLGYNSRNIRVIVLHTDNNEETSRRLWQSSAQAAIVNKIKKPCQIGTGYATGKKGRIWVVVLAGVSKGTNDE